MSRPNASLPPYVAQVDEHQRLAYSDAELAGWDLSRPMPEGWQPTQDALREAAEQAGGHADQPTPRTR
jgi:hypothetical protein